MTDDANKGSGFFHQIWSQALTTVQGAEGEAQKLLAKLQGVSQEESRKLAERLQGQRKDLEKRVEDVVKTSVARLRVPRREEVAQLTARVEALARRVENLSK
ncbi:MAG: phasin family protein [Archangium sp.]|nr:phasin family protein [Archangium sp.]